LREVLACAMRLNHGALHESQNRAPYKIRQILRSVKPLKFELGPHPFRNSGIGPSAANPVMLNKSIFIFFRLLSCQPATQFPLKEL
jgi:hypothetical protein